MREAIDECYSRFGRYLNPDITVSPIWMRNGKDKYIPYEGQCLRTGLKGPVIAHHKSDGTIVPTSTKLLWLVSYQNRVNDTSYRMSFGWLAILPSTILSTVEWANKTGVRIPGLSFVESTKDMVRRVIGEDRYLFFGFGKNMDRTLGNGLRYSSGYCFEINGECKIAGLELTNQSVNFEIPLQLSAMNLDWNAARRYYDLRNRATGLSDGEHAEMLDLKDNFGIHANQMMRLSRRISRDDIRLARWLST